MTILEIERKIVPVLKRNGVIKAAFFGSFVKGKAGKKSDIDILVDLQKDKSLLDFVGLKLELEEVLGMKVDLVEYSTIKPLIRDKILREQRVII